LGINMGVLHAPPPNLFTILSALYIMYIQNSSKNPCIFFWSLLSFWCSSFQALDSCFCTSAGIPLLYSIELLQEKIQPIVSFLSCLFLVALTFPCSRILSLLHSPSTIHLAKAFTQKERANPLPKPLTKVLH